MNNHRPTSAASSNDAARPLLTPSYFQGAPVTKFFITVMSAVFVLTQYQIQHGSSSASRLNNGHGLNDYAVEGYWKDLNVLQQIICFPSFGEMFIGGFALIMPLMRSFEREFGSRLFFSYIVVSVGLSMLYFECMKAMFVFHGSEYVSMGLYSLMGVLMHLYYTLIPRLYPKFMGVLGIDFSEKSMTYLLFCMALPMSIVPAICGVGASMLCSSNAIMPIITDYFTLPDFIYRIVNAVLGPWFVTVDPRASVEMRTRQMQPNIRPNANTNGNVPANVNENQDRPQQDQFQAPPRAPPPSEEAIANLTAMGFDREAVIRTLQQCDNNVEVAANRLLSE